MPVRFWSPTPGCAWVTNSENCRSASITLMFRDKWLIIGIVATLVIIVGGVFLFSKGTTSNNSSRVSDTILVPSDSQKTGGVDKNVYQPPNSSASVTLVEFGDYECPACGAYSPLVKQLLTDFNGKINFVFRNFPLSQHANALISSYAAEAAGMQGKFWQMHDRLYDKQNDWASAKDAKSIFIGYAGDLGLDTAKFAADIDSQTVKDKIGRDTNDGKLVNLNATPTFYINGIKLEGLPPNYSEFKKIIGDALNNIKSAPSTPAPTYHAYFDLKVYTDGTPIDFSLAKYQESKTNTLDPNIHFHDGNGTVVHLHKEGIALAELFLSLKISFPLNSLDKSLKVYVNGAVKTEGLNYVPQDLDQILVSFGPTNDTNIQKQLSSVSNDSCIYSLKCPARGTPPPEDCVGGLGTGCTD